MNSEATPSGQAAQPRLVSYDDWARLLCDHFFRAEYDGVPVMFFVDDEALAKLYGGSSREAVDGLVTAVLARLDGTRPRQLFRRIERETVRWKVAGGDGPPPCLPLLALTVLAATRMGRGRDRAAHNYYKPFCELLRLDGDREHVVESYRDAIPYLWNALQWWLDDKHRGRLGFSTIVEDSFFTYIGYADSQTLFSSSDRDKLTQFFRWIRLRPGERVEQSDLMTYFRIWASRRDDVSEGTAYMLESEEYSLQLAQIVKAAADRWRGVVREEGKRWAEILVTLELFPGPQLGLVAERPGGFPAELVCRGPLGQEVTLTSSHEGWYDEIPGALSRSTLDAGLRLVADDFQLRLPPYNVHVLEKSPELGKWASVAELSPGVPTWLLVRGSALLDVTTYLDSYARKGWSTVKREGLAPPGWSLIGEVLIDAAVTDDVPPHLSRIIPRVQNRFSLRGGLPLPRGTSVYLEGGEPDVWLPPPPEDAATTPLELDEGEHVDLPAATSRFRLAGRALGAGHHTIAMDGISRSFSTIRTLGQIAPPIERPIVHPLRRVGDSCEALAPGAQLADRLTSLGELHVAGAVVEDPAAILGEPPTFPLILPIEALRRVVLGARPGEMDEVPAPRRPPWTIRADLEFQVFEFVPRFPVVWVVTEWSGEPTVRTRLKEQLPVALPVNDSLDPELLVGWARTITRSLAPDGSDAVLLWEGYRACAREMSSS